MTPTERDRNRYAIMEEARETYSKLLGDETGAPDENLSAEEARVLAILAVAEKSPLPARALLDAAYFYLERGTRPIRPRRAEAAGEEEYNV